VPVLPQTGDLGVSAFVRRQREIEERQAEEQRAAERQRERDWGPARSGLTRPRRAGVVAAILAGAALCTWRFGFHWTPDRALLVFLPAAIVLGRTRRYVIDFVPFAVLLFAYAEFRGLAHMINPHPFYKPQMIAERFLFFGHIPSSELQHWLGTGQHVWWNVMSQQLLKIHFVVPPVLGFVLWMRRRALFYRFAATMLSLSFAGAFLFVVYPAAPPWAAHNRGFLYSQMLPLQKYGPPPPVSGTASGGGHWSLASLIPGNPYAAIPSLHGGYAFLVFLFVATLAWKRQGWRRWVTVGLAALYPIAQSFAVVYTANHYVVDLLIGFAMATGALLLVQRFWRRHGLPE
jgi:membrane-associated phospholipid phosphatase